MAIQPGTPEWWYQAGRGAVIIGWIFVVITILAMLGEGIYFGAVFYLIGGIVSIVVGKTLQQKNAP